MDVAIAISMTSRDSRLLMVEGASGRGAMIDHYSFDVGTTEQLVNAVSDAYAVAVANGNPVARVVLTRTTAMTAATKRVLAALADRGITDVGVVATTDALEAAAEYTCEEAGYDSIALCVGEEDSTWLAVVGAADENGQRRRRSRRLDGPEADSTALAVRGLCAGFPEPIAALAVAGPVAGLKSLAEEMDSVMLRPVTLTDDASLLLGRGALMASAATERPAAESTSSDSDEGDDETAARYPLVHTLAMLAATIVLLLVGSVVVAVAVRGGGDSGSPPQAYTPPSPSAPAPLPPPSAEPQRVVVVSGVRPAHPSRCPVPMSPCRVAETIGR